MIEVLSTDGEEAQIRVDGRVFFVPYLIQGASVHFAFDGEIYIVETGEKNARARARHGGHSTSAPMPGVVLRILVAVGDVVAKGATLLILEAMKMEHPITAPRDGTVSSVNCREGEMVQPGVELVVLNTP